MPGDKKGKFNEQKLAVRDWELAHLNEYLSSREGAEPTNDNIDPAIVAEGLDARDLNEDLAELSRTMLCEMSLTDLMELERRVDEIKQRGKADYAAWKQEQELKTEAAMEPLIKAMGGKVGADSNTVVIPGRTKLGKEVSKITKALINTLNPSRVFDLLDGHADFRGAWHEFFKHGADKAEDSYLRSKNRRISNMGSIMEAYGITENNLRDVRLKY